MSLQQPAPADVPACHDAGDCISIRKVLRLLGLCRARLRLNMHGQRIDRGPQESYALTKGSSTGRARAAILVLARNQDCDSVLLSMQRMERRFNSKFQYPYIFLNNVNFEIAFQKRQAFCTLALHTDDIGTVRMSAVIYRPA